VLGEMIRRTTADVPPTPAPRKGAAVVPAKSSASAKSPRTTTVRKRSK